jgi:hypothetical protein
MPSMIRGIDGNSLGIQKCGKFIISLAMFSHTMKNEKNSLNL